MKKEGWNPHKLNQLGIVSRGKSRHRPRNDPVLYGGMYPFFQTGDIKVADLILTKYTQTYNENGLAQSKLWNPGTLCITIAANIAETAVLGIKGCFPDSVVGFIANPNMCNVRFIKYYFDTMKIEMQNVSKGTTQDNLSLDKLLTFDFYIPPLPTQHKIAAILSAYDELIENNTRRIKILEEMAQGIYREWFVHFRFPGHEGVRMVESDLGLIPEGWEVCSVDHTFEILGGGTPSTKIVEYWDPGTINWYSPSDLTSSETMFMDCSSSRISELGFKESSAKLFPAFSVMMTSRATLGVISINTTEACTNQGFITCIPNEQFPLYFLYHWLKENVERFISLGSGSTFKEITKGVFKTIQLVIPPSKISLSFEKTVEPIALQILNFQRKNMNLRRTRDSLLPKLINGELNVSKLDIRIPEAEA